MRTLVRLFALSYTHEFKEDKPLPAWAEKKAALLRAAADDRGCARLPGVGEVTVQSKRIAVDPITGKVTGLVDANATESIDLHTPEWEAVWRRPRGF